MGHLQWGVAHFLFDHQHLLRLQMWVAAYSSFDFSCYRLDLVKQNLADEQFHKFRTAQRLPDSETCKSRMPIFLCFQLHLVAENHVAETPHRFHTEWHLLD